MRGGQTKTLRERRPVLAERKRLRYWQLSHAPPRPPNTSTGPAALILDNFQICGGAACRERDPTRTRGWTACSRPLRSRASIDACDQTSASRDAVRGDIAGGPRTVGGDGHVHGIDRCPAHSLGLATIPGAEHTGSRGRRRARRRLNWRRQAMGWLAQDRPRKVVLGGRAPSGVGSGPPPDAAAIATPPAATAPPMMPIVVAEIPFAAPAAPAAPAAACAAVTTLVCAIVTVTGWPSNDGARGDLHRPMRPQASTRRRSRCPGGVRDDR